MEVVVIMGFGDHSNAIIEDISEMDLTGRKSRR
jgi:hypothetical protein